MNFEFDSFMAKIAIKIAAIALICGVIGAIIDNSFLLITTMAILIVDIIIAFLGIIGIYLKKG